MRLLYFKSYHCIKANVGYVEGNVANAGNSSDNMKFRKIRCNESVISFYISMMANSDICIALPKIPFYFEISSFLKVEKNLGVQNG